jgi:hypothetical protein
MERFAWKFSIIPIPQVPGFSWICREWLGQIGIRKLDKLAFSRVFGMFGTSWEASLAEGVGFERHCFY